GDMVDWGDEPHYSTFFTCYQELLKSHILFPVIGNHEYSPGTATSPLGNFRTYFDYPRSGTETWYSFTYGNTRFIAADMTPVIHSPASWLDAELAAAEADPQIRHIFVAFHAPPYSSCQGFTAATDQWEVTVSEQHLENNNRSGKLRAVLNGHVHNYEHLVKG